MSGNSLSSQQVLLNLLGSTMATPTWPAHWYLGVSTTVPTYAQGTSPYWNFTEPVDTAYVRQAVVLAATPSQPSGAYGMSPNTVVTFPTASVNWATALYLGIFDAQTGGNLWYFTPLVRTATDGAVTAGSTTLTSASISFTSSDVGEVVQVPGVPVGATIASVTDATTAVMSAEANVTGSALLIAVGTPVVVNSGSVFSLAAQAVVFGLQ